MIRSTLIILLSLFLSLPLHAANSPLDILESAAPHQEALQPGLKNYQATVETGKIDEIITQMTASMPPDIPRPATPVVTKYWSRLAARSLIMAEEPETAPYVTQMIERFSTSLAVELDNMLLPVQKAAKRQELTAKATVKLNEVTIADAPLQHIEFDFDIPVDLDQAFYTTGLRLPQKQIKKLAFDIDTKNQVVSELSLLTAEGLKLTVEIRYQEVAGGHLLQRVHTTSPDGLVDDLTEVTFAEVAGFQLPVRMVRTLHRPDLQDELDVRFTNYQVNHLLPENIRTQLLSGS